MMDVYQLFWGLGFKKTCDMDVEAQSSKRHRNCGWASMGSGTDSHLNDERQFATALYETQNNA